MSIFKSIFSVIIHALKAIIDNFRIIAVVMVVLAIAGIVLETIKPKVYTSSMLVRPYFDSKYQLVKNIDYYNALIDNDDYKKLSKIFEMNKDTIQKVLKFEVDLAFESENTKILKYESFLKSIDSTRAINLTYDDFIENEDVYSGNEFEILVESTKKDIFLDLKKGISASFTNEYSTNKKKKKDSLNFLQKQNLLSAIEEVDSLQRVYIDVLEEESKSPSSALKLGEGLALDSDKSNTREYDLLNKEIQLRDLLRKLEQEKVEEDVFFDIISDFQAVGETQKEITDRYSIIFPLAGFLLLCLLFLTSRLVRFVKNYEE